MICFTLKVVEIVQTKLCFNRLKEKAPVSLAIKGPSVSWYRPVSLAELLQLRNEFPHYTDKSKPQYRLVMGNTEIGK